MMTTLTITGGARGIGLSVARLAVQRGAAVALIDIDEQKLEQAAAEIAGEGEGPIVPLVCDVSDAEQVETAFESAVKELGPPGGLVASAGVDRGGPAHELDPDAWEQVIAVNLRGTFLACRAALGYMIEAGGGAVVCVSSPFASVSPPRAGAYSASKGGVSALVRSLAVDYAPHGIRVNAVLPGPTETELMWANVPAERVEETRAALSREIPLGRLADPAEPAEAILWLLSDHASYVTGSQLACDGGVLAKASVPV